MALDANPRLSVNYALANNNSPATFADAQRAQLLAQQLQDNTTAAENPVGIGGAITHALAAALKERQLGAVDAQLVGDGQQGQQSAYQTLASNIGLNGSTPNAAPSPSPSPQALGAALSGQPAPEPTPGPASTLPAASPQGPSTPAPAMQQPMPSMSPPAPTQTAQGPPEAGPQGFPGAASPATGSAGGVSPQVGPPITPQDRDALIRMTYGEARGEPAAGQAATAAVALNRSLATGAPVAQIVSAPGQFEGMHVGAQLDPNSPEYAKIASVVDPLLSGQYADPSGGATHFYAPGAQAALGRAAPAWAAGQQGRQIGNQVFYSLPYGGQPGQQVAPAGPTSPQLPGSPTPTPPVSNAPLAAPQQVYGNGPTDLERQTIRSYLASPNPQLREQALQMMSSISTRMRTPVEYDEKQDGNGGVTYIPKTPGQGPIQYAAAPAGYRPAPPSGMMWGPDGQVHVMPGNSYSAPQKAGPTGIVQYDPFGKASLSTIPGADAQWGAPHAVQGADGLYQTNSATGEVRKAADSNFSTTDVGKQLSELYTSPEMAKMQKTGEMYRSLVSAASRPGGVPDAELIDNAAQLFSGGVARQFNQKMLDEAQGPLARLQQFGGQILSGQHLSPQARQAIIQAAHDYASEASTAFGQREASAQAFAKAHGQDLSSYLSPFSDQLPDVPTLGSIPSGTGGVQGGNGGQLGSGTGGGMGGGPPGGMAGPQMGGGPAATQNVLAQARQAIQQGAPRAAVVQRLQRMGVNPAGL